MNDDPKVKALKDRIESNREERERYQRMYDKLQEHTAAIVDSPDKTRYPFWCQTCKSDFTGIGTKVVRKLKGRLPVAWYVAYCPQRHKCIRRITQRVQDPYFVRSFIVKRDRSRYGDDLLTPDNPRFWLLYGNKHNKDIKDSLNNNGKQPDGSSSILG